MNQPKAVERFLTSITKQVRSDLEILVHDDSTDGKTKKIIEFYSKKENLTIDYFKGFKSSKGGYDKALLSITQRAKGDYIWWFGDDQIADNAIDIIFSKINHKDNFSFLWINSRNIDNIHDKGLDLNGDKTFYSASEIIEINLGLLGFPSITIFKRDEALEAIEKAKDFIGTTLTGFYLIMHVISQADKKFIFIQEPIILSDSKPAGEIRWYDSFQVHAVNYFLILKEFKYKIYSRSIRKAMVDQYGRIWRAVIIERSMGLSTGFASNTPKIWKMTKLYWTFPEFYIALPLMLLPRLLLIYIFQFRGKIYKYPSYLNKKNRDKS